MTSTLKVNTIQGASNTTTTIKTNGGTDAMTIDTSGRILTPARPAFHVQNNAQQTASANNETVLFQVVNLNSGGHWDASNHKFTVPVAGIYVFDCQWLSVNDNAAHDLAISKKPSGGSHTEVSRTRNATVSLHETTTMHYVGQFGVGDEVEVRLSNNGQKVYGDSNVFGWTSFMGYLLG